MMTSDYMLFHVNPLMIHHRTKAARSVGGFRTMKNPVPVGSNQRIGWPEADIKNVGIANVLGAPNNLV